MLYSIAPAVSHLQKTNVNKGTIDVTGARVNRGADYGVGISCKYRFHGTKLKEYVEEVPGTSI